MRIIDRIVDRIKRRRTVWVQTSQPYEYDMGKGIYDKNRIGIRRREETRRVDLGMSEELKNNIAMVERAMYD